MSFIPLPPFDTTITIEHPPHDPNYPFTYDCDITIEASYYIGTPNTPDDPDDIRLDKVIRISDNEDITNQLTEDQVETLQMEVNEKVAEEESRLADRGVDDGESDSGNDD